MTDLLQKVFSEEAKIPPEEQDAFARWMLYELQSEQRWNELFARSPELVQRLAAEAIAEHETGLTSPLGPDDL